MKMELSGSEEVEAGREALWTALNDPDVLARCIPGCKEMMETAQDSYDVKLGLKVAAVSGSFDGKVALTEKVPPETCWLSVSGGGTLGTGNGSARFTITEISADRSRLDYSGEGEIGGLVAGVGQRVLKSVSKHLTNQFFVSLRNHFSQDEKVG
ncbi:carbon monoxide dehydrogenase [Agaricicola taiwanensis]|uniref:Carbon monoxide dehydrogenase n=1 Tax=Agaricicola taiwanensis TaxID=591372 RepID=A0A8J2VNM6_9RHOB|nr:carbon monoxide dehydrogenase subunit G [Agaricicola taiwanensis]GGE31025.1 carbon monoxide dehydrogenase [Agaricicola taiwanensis]